ncbi:uncharacterized protein BDR25DRAFT_356038 [Lindgomyces ingoldianus]|uniref:Uncharacterized protein n=1 Tax=Lindgomyces ingoldianus TaxID=673940 RepID=A0ACB6QSH1_9PLEO|nr:uncharacterized protein BDR25DRAFT_356038 [Lindgomyces ingoldianus]KAF2469787.1 hypothetical protein BDR25DRAFT_356038 [Lindgomyces ingoldianus]
MGHNRVCWGGRLAHEVRYNFSRGKKDLRSVTRLRAIMSFLYASSHSAVEWFTGRSLNSPPSTLFSFAVDHFLIFITLADQTKSHMLFGIYLLNRLVTAIQIGIRRVSKILIKIQYRHLHLRSCLQIPYLSGYPQNPNLGSYLLNPYLRGHLSVLITRSYLQNPNLGGYPLDQNPGGHPFCRFQKNIPHGLDDAQSEQRFGNDGEDGKDICDDNGRSVDGVNAGHGTIASFASLGAIGIIFRPKARSTIKFITKSGKLGYYIVLPEWGRVIGRVALRRPSIDAKIRYRVTEHLSWSHGIHFPADIGSAFKHNRSEVPKPLGSHYFAASTSNTTSLPARASAQYDDPIGIHSWSLGFTFEDSDLDAGVNLSSLHSTHYFEQIADIDRYSPRNKYHEFMHWHDFNVSTNSTYPVQTLIAGNVTYEPIVPNIGQ